MSSVLKLKMAFHFPLQSMIKNKKIPNQQPILHDQSHTQCLLVFSSNLCFFTMMELYKDLRTQCLLVFSPNLCCLTIMELYKDLRENFKRLND